MKVTIELRAELLKLKGLEIRAPPSLDSFCKPLSKSKVLESRNKSFSELILELLEGNESVENQLKSSKLALNALIVFK